MLAGRQAEIQLSLMRSQRPGRFRAGWPRLRRPTELNNTADTASRTFPETHEKESDRDSSRDSQSTLA